jgi:hypothetical protein
MKKGSFKKKLIGLIYFGGDIMKLHNRVLARMNGVGTTPKGVFRQAQLQSNALARIPADDVTFLRNVVRFSEQAPGVAERVASIECLIPGHTAMNQTIYGRAKLMLDGISPVPF